MILVVVLGVLIGFLPGTLSASHGIGGEYDMAVSEFAPLPVGDPLTGDMVLGDPLDGCDTFTNAAAVSGNFVLVLADEDCDAADRYQNAVAAGATGLIAYMDGAGEPVPMTDPGGVVVSPTIPAVTIDEETGLDIAGAVGSHTVRVSLVSDGIDGFYIHSRPTFSGTLSATDVTETSLTLQWPAADDPDDDVVEYRAFRGATPIGTVPYTAAASFTLPVTSLAPGTQYTFTVIAVDAVGLESEPLESVVSTLIAPTWPAPSLTATATGTTTASLSWNAAFDPDDGLVEYRITRNGAPHAIVPAGTTTYSATGLTPGTTYTFGVTAYDIHDLTTSELTDTVSAWIAPTWPASPELTVTVTGETTATLSWPTATDPDFGLDEYRITRNGAPHATVPAGTTTYNATGLTPGATYTFGVTAYDIHDLTTSELTDTVSAWIAPTWPGGSVLTVTPTGQTTVTVSWPAATDPDGGLSGYLVFRDATEIADLGAGAHSHNVTGLTPGQSYAFSVVAYDTDGLESLPLTEDGVIPVPTTAGAFDPATGLWFLLNSQGGETTFYFGNPGDYPFMGDWNCDGIDTPGLYRQSDGFVYLRNTNNQGVADITFFFGNPGDVPIAGDFNNDGCDTVSIYRPSNQTFYIINQLGQNGGGLGQAQFSYVFGNPGDKPFVGDFNGNGQDTVGLHRESTGLVYFRNTHTQGNADAQFIFGDPGDRLLAGDWGIVNGIDTPGLFRPSNRTWYFRHTNTQGNADSQFFWGQSHWLPVSGRFGLG